jgi:hypothetical protein
MAALDASKATANLNIETESFTIKPRKKRSRAAARCCCRPRLRRLFQRRPFRLP